MHYLLKVHHGYHTAQRPKYSPGVFDSSLSDYSFITINSPARGVNDIELLACVLDSVNASNSTSGRNFDAILCPFSTPKPIKYYSTSKLDSSDTKKDRNQGQTSKSSATVRGPVGSVDPQPSNNHFKTVYLVAYSKDDIFQVNDCKCFAAIASNAFQSTKDNTQLEKRWVCEAETHNQTSGSHYHLAIHLKNRGDGAMFGHGWLTYIILTWPLDSLAKCSTMHKHMLQK